MSNKNENDNKNLNISIFSYNIFWKIMNAEIGSPLINNMGLKKLMELKSNIISNISNVINYYNPYIYCFQEAESSKDIINLFNKNYYKYHLGYSEPEHILTIWRKDIMKKKLVFDGEFESGRPFSIIVFKDTRFKVYWMLINIHSGHDHNTKMSIFEPIQKIIDLNKNKISKYDIKRVIIVGDFNRDISSQIKLEPSGYKIKINSKEFLFNYLENNNKTCCSLKGWGYKSNYDQTIDSYSKPILIHQLNKEKWYKTESSDHLAIMAIFQNKL